MVYYCDSKYTETPTTLDLKKKIGGMVCIILNGCTPVDLGEISNESVVTISELVECSIRQSNEFALNIDVSRVVGLRGDDVTFYIDNNIPEEFPDILDVVYASNDSVSKLNDIDGLRAGFGELQMSEQFQHLLYQFKVLQSEFDEIGKDFDEYFQPNVESDITINSHNVAGLDDKSILAATFAACSKGDVDGLLLLFKMYGDKKVVNLKNTTSFTPLHCACFNGQFEVVAALLKHGADVSVTAKMNMTPLHVAASAGHIQITKLLLGYNADPFEPDLMGHTALDKARMGNHYEIVDMIGKRGEAASK
jgi:hypothetical protein